MGAAAGFHSANLTLNAPRHGDATCQFSLLWMGGGAQDQMGDAQHADVSGLYARTFVKKARCDWEGAQAFWQKKKSNIFLFKNTPAA